jgi:hypothetical protein
MFNESELDVQQVRLSTSNPVHHSATRGRRQNRTRWVLSLGPGRAEIARGKGDPTG